MREKKKRNGSLVTGIVLVFLIGLSLSCASKDISRLQFEISFPATVNSGELTGRVYVMITSNDRREPRFQAGGWSNSVPFFAKDVEKMKPGDSAVIDETVLGYPLQSLQEIPAGDYYVQALINIYTEFRRSDGHVIWAHMDQWEGQSFTRSPGNLYSEVQKVHLDPGRGYTIKLSLDKVIPPVEAPEDTEWVKHIKFQSPLLSEFWGQPIYLGATVLLPKGYDSHPDVEYPVHYIQGHFSLRPPYGFREESGFFKTWTAEDFPRMIAVTFQHPCPFFDDSYAVNSANCGPYGDALLTELIPLLEEEFRIIRKPYARVLSGGSTGGWEALALQIFHPEFFGGTWSFFPDPVDFRYYQLVNIYEDDNAFFIDQGWMKPERPMMRDGHGQVMVTFRQMSQLEAVLGSRGRSGQQMDAWNAVYGPVGKDGYPQLLWDKETGVIDHDVAEYLKDYDLRLYLEKNWRTIGPQLVGKLHVYCGDMDNFYLNEAVYELEAFLESTENPYYAGSFQYGRPRKTHGWNPFDRNTGEMERAMAELIVKNTPPGEDIHGWRYK
jgi:S-formylglutathione hydrolase FrmB